MESTDNYDEVVLLKRLQDGDHKAFEVLYVIHSKALYCKIWKMLQHSTDADELLQELFVKVWERRSQIDPLQPFAAYLYRIAQRMVVDHYRRLARTAKVYDQVRYTNPSASVSSTDEVMISREITHLLEDAIAILPAQRRQAFVLCKLEGKSYKETAALMNISTNTVRNHLVKALETIRTHVTHARPGTEGLLLVCLFSVIVDVLFD